MHRIIAGATGLVGKKLVAHWLEQKHQLTVIGRSKNKIAECFGSKVAALEWKDLTAEHLLGADVVVNLTGAGIADKRWTEARKKEIIESRVASTQKLAALLETLGENAPALFNASAIGVYGLQEQNPNKNLPLRLDENTPVDFNAAPDFLSEVGRKWEVATHSAKAQGVRVVNLRFAVVLAKKGGALPMLARPFYFFLGGPLGNGRQAFSWVEMDDLIRAIDYLIPLQDVSGAINIAAPNCVTQRELANTLGATLHRPAGLHTPGFALKLLLGEMARELLLEGQNVYPQRLSELGFKFSCPDIISALKKIYS